MDEELPILEREAFREELKQLGPHGTTVRVTHDAFAFLEGNVITVDDLHFTAEDGDNALIKNLLHFTYSNPTPGIVPQDRLIMSIRESKVGLGRLNVLSDECWARRPMIGLLGYFLLHEGVLALAYGLKKSMFVDAESRMDMWEAMMMRLPRTGIHSSVFFSYLVETPITADYSGGDLVH